jgi:hypothetical protein
MPNSSSFTARSSGGLLRALRTACRIGAAFDPAVLQQPQSHEFQALWDTGATNSCITQRVVDACGLVPIGLTQVFAFNSSGLADAFLVSIVLPNRVSVPSVRVTKGDIASGIDVIIGMDIITTGDFVITNRNGDTVFSFCYPSERCIDFVQEHNAKNPKRGFRGYKPPVPKQVGKKQKHRR